RTVEIQKSSTSEIQIQTGTTVSKVSPVVTITKLASDKNRAFETLTVKVIVKGNSNAEESADSSAFEFPFTITFTVSVSNARFLSDASFVIVTTGDTFETVVPVWICISEVLLFWISTVR